MLRWKRINTNLIAAVSSVGSYEIAREERGGVWRLFVEGEEYATPGLKAVLKNVADTLNGDRKRRIGKR